MKKHGGTRFNKPLYGNREPNYAQFKLLKEDSINKDINKEWENEAPDMPFRMPIKVWVQQQIPFNEFFEVDMPKLNGLFKNKYENETTKSNNDGGQKGDKSINPDSFTTFPDYL